MKGKKILDVKVDCTGKNVSLVSEGREVLMIPFTGTVTGPLFEGMVEPCGVDTQTVSADGVRHMSARYMLTGKDCKGESAHIYVENNGCFRDGEVPMPFQTVPVFRTDSKALAPYLHADRFAGEGSSEEDGLHICFYDVLDGEEGPDGAQP